VNVVLRVMGTPAPQGSKRHVGRGIMVESSKAVGPWREAVVGEAQRQGAAGLMIPAAVIVTLTFYVGRPKGHYRTGRNANLLRDSAPKYPAGKPDLDKLTRSTLDGLVQAGVIADDALVVDMVARKAYAGPPVQPGAWIEIEEMP